MADRAGLLKASLVNNLGCLTCRCGTYEVKRFYAGLSNRDGPPPKTKTTAEAGTNGGRETGYHCSGIGFVHSTVAPVPATVRPPAPWCFYCKRTLNEGRALRRGDRNKGLDFTIDHKTPLCRGGADTKENKVPCCHRCNNLKGDMTAQEFRSYTAHFGYERRPGRARIGGAV